MTDFSQWRYSADLPSAAARDGQRPLLSTELIHQSGAVVVCLSGEMDLASAPPMEREVQRFLAMPIDSVTIDLSNVTFTDSTGLQTLYVLCRQAEERRVPFVLRSIPQCVRKVLDLTEMGGEFAIESRPFAIGFD